MDRHTAGVVVLLVGVAALVTSVLLGAAGNGAMQRQDTPVAERALVAYPSLGQPGCTPAWSLTGDSVHIAPGKAERLPDLDADNPRYVK